MANESARRDKKPGCRLPLRRILPEQKPATLREWERDRSAPRVNKLVNLAGILGVSPTHLIAEEGQSDNPVNPTRGRQDRLLMHLKAELLEIESQQKVLSKRLTSIVKLLGKLN